MPDLSLLEGAGILAAGMGLGRFWPARRKHPKPKPPPRPVCGCGHNLAHHEVAAAGGSACHAQVRGAITKWNAYGEAIGWMMGRCSCKQYTGPTPLPEFFAPEIT
jgi:hypothetical protein